MATSNTDSNVAEKQPKCLRCEKCHKCRDWYFSGSPKTWKWVRNYATWEEADWKRWRDNKVWEQFKLFYGCTCVPRKRYPHSSSNSDAVIGFTPTYGTLDIGSFRHTDYDTHFLYTTDSVADWLTGLPPTHYVKRIENYAAVRPIEKVFYTTLESYICFCEDDQTN